MADQRRFVRFTLFLPVELTHLRNRVVRVFGETRNISAGGVLFATKEAAVGVGDAVEFLVSLSPADHSQVPVRLRCQGRVVRLTTDDDLGPTQMVAATVERYEFLRGD